MRLSLAMIVKNEAPRLAHCLESVRGLVDEMIVVDTGSTDGTADLARSLGATVLPHAWQDDFAEARNAALAACTGDWILVLDADEALDARDHGAIRTALEDPSAHAYRLWMRNYLKSGAFLSAERGIQANDDRYGEGRAYGHFQLGRRLRLFRAQGQPVFEGRVHELADPYFEARALEIRDLDATIHHLGKVGYGKDLTKQAHYLALAQADARAHGEDPQRHWNVLNEAMALEDWPVVLEAAQAYLRLRDQAPALVFLGSAKAMTALGRAPEALETLRSLLDADPSHAPALVVKGEALAALGRTDEALAAYGAAMAAQPALTLSFFLAARLLDGQGRGDLARRVLEAGLDQNPQDLRLWEALVGHSARFDAARAAADAWDALQAVPDGGEGIWHLLVARTLEGQGDPEEAREVVRRGLEAFPGHPELVALAGR